MQSSLCSYLMICAILFAIATQPGVTQARTGERCFAETGFCISGRIREFWEQNGGLPVFGFPITPVTLNFVDGREITVQWFERNRLELHPENLPPYDVLLGRLGEDRLRQQGRDWRLFPQTGPQPGCRFFAETGQSVCGDILKAWRATGLEFDRKPGTSEAESLALFGLPLSGLVTETGADGRQYQVQWFERARFELHPENTPPYHVLLGLLGNELRDGGMVLQPSPADFEREVIRLTNLERTSRGLAPLREHPVLTAAARAHNDDMARNDFFSHTGSDGSQPWDRARAHGYNFSTFGENIAYGYMTPEQVVRGWMASEGHRQNILTPDFRDIGVGYHSMKRLWTMKLGASPDTQ